MGRSQKMRLLLFLYFSVYGTVIPKDDYPSYNLCKVFNPDQMSSLIPDMGLLNQWPRSEINPDYEEKGKVITIGDLNLYVVGEGSTAIIWNYDVYGFTAGRTREYCDLFAEQGFLVVLPDYFRSDTFPEEGLIEMGEFMCKYTNWEKLKYDIDEVVIPYLRVNGATKFGTVGTCWGGYNIIKLSEYTQCLFAIGFHASHFPMMKFTTGEDYIAAFQAVSNDVFLANSIGEPEENSQGGLLDQIMGDKHEFYARDYDQNHGFVTRGDLSDPNIEADVNDALTLAIEFAINRK